MPKASATARATADAASRLGNGAPGDKTCRLVLGSAGRSATSLIDGSLSGTQRRL